MHYLDIELYIFQEGLLSITRGLKSLLAGNGVCHSESNKQI